MILNILLGIIGLGIVVFVHEFGHFSIAKLCGISVEVFSIGWGKKIYSWKRGDTEYRLSLFPVGGYCKMKGEELFKKAVETRAEEIPYEKGSLFSVSAWKRLLTYLAGPLFNFLFSVLVLCFVWFVGFSITTSGNRIILISDYPELNEARIEYPADASGLKTGDRIIAIDGEPVSTYAEIQERISVSALKPLLLTVERDGTEITIPITPALEKETGAGKIGVFSWIDPEIGSVKSGSAADIAGLRAGDRIVEAAGRDVQTSLDFYTLLLNKPERIPLTYQRNGSLESTTLIPLYNESGEADVGFSFAYQKVRSPKLSFGRAFVKGIEESVSTFVLSLKGLGLLGKGVKLNDAVSGPLRISYYVGEVATNSIQLGLGEGLVNLFRFLSLLSVALSFGNLIPIPALDGGLIVLAIIEMIRRKAVRPNVFYRYQMVGYIVIIAIMFFATASDIFFFMKQ